MVQQTRAVPGPRSVHRARAGLPLRVQLRVVDVLPGHRSDLPPHRPRDHQGRPLLSGDAAARDHAAVVPGAHAPDGPAGRGAARGWAAGERPGDRGVQGSGRERAPAVPTGSGGLAADRRGDGGADPDREPGGERRVPAAAVPDRAGPGGERAAGADLQFDVRRPDDLRGGREHLAGGAAGDPAVGRARPDPLANHLRARGPAAHGRGQPAHHLAHAERRGQRGRHRAGRRAEGRHGGRPLPDRRRCRRLALSLHALRHLRHEPVRRFSAQGRAAGGEAREGSLARRSRGEDRRVPERPAQPRAVRDRAPQALRLAAGRAGLRAGRVSAGDPLAPWGPEHRPGGQPRDPRHVLPDDDLARGRGAARAHSGRRGDLGGERGLRRRGARAPDRDGARVAVAGDARAVARARSAAPRAAGASGLAPAPPPGRRLARLDAHHRSVSRARVRRVHGDRPGRRVGALRRDRSGEDPGQVSPGEAAADVHPRALCLPAPGGAARRAAGRHARSDDLSLFDLEPLPRADRAQGGGREPVSGQRAGARRGAAGGGRRGALPGAGPAGAQRAR